MMMCMTELHGENLCSVKRTLLLVCRLVKIMWTREKAIGKMLLIDKAKKELFSLNEKCYVWGKKNTTYKKIILSSVKHGGALPVQLHLSQDGLQ